MCVVFIRSGVQNDWLVNVLVVFWTWNFGRRREFKVFRGVVWRGTVCNHETITCFRPEI
jgi:hypothetical protein